MTLPSFITSAQVARLLDLPSPESFLARRDQLEALGFPLPVAWSARPMRWRAELVQAWIDRQGLPRAVGNKPQLVTSDYLTERARRA